MNLFAKSRAILESLRGATSQTQVRRVPMLVEEFEPRILHSADIGPALLHDGAAAPQVETRVLDAGGEYSADASQTQQVHTELVIVDTRTPDYQQLVDDIRSEAAGGRQIEVVLLDNRADGIDQITEMLSGRKDIGAIHIISHGSEGEVQLGGSVLDLQSLRDHAAEIESWANALTADADLLIYGCNVAGSPDGRTLIDALSRLTGADVAASEDVTGNAALGGDWILEYQVGGIQAQNALTQQAQDEWSGLLASVADGGELQVNATLGGNQTDAATAMDANGNFVVVWTADGNLDGGGRGIFAQRFDAGGNKVGGEVRVNTTTAGDQTHSSVAMGPSGNYVVVWMGGNQDPDASDGVYAQRFDSSGVAQGSEFRVNSTIAGNQVSPSVATDAIGNFAVAWTSNQNGNLDVFARRFDAAGSPLGAEILVNTTLAGNQAEANVAMASSGSFVVVWTADGNLDGNGKGIFAQRFDATGSKLGGEVRINATAAKDQTQASIAMDPVGNYVVAWTSTDQDGDKAGVFAQRFDAAGVAQGGEFRVNTQSHNTQDAPSVSIDGAGRFTVVWQSNNQDGSNKGIYGQSYDATGFAIGSEFRINLTTSNAQSLPSITMRGNGDFVVAWEGRSATDSSGVAAQRYLSLNQAPVNVVPGAQVAGGAVHVFSTAVGNAIRVTDVDAGGALERVTLTATNGALTLSQITGLGFLAGDGTADATMTFDGTLAAINAALDGMSFTATQSFSGAASVQIVSSDLGNTGAGGSLTDTDTVNITVVSMGTPFIISGSFTGNATDNRSITGLSFAPDVVIVKARDSNEIGVIRTSTMAGDLTKELTSGKALVANEIQSLDANGFTIGTSDTVNKAAATYDWIAFKTSPGFLTVGTYTGDGSAGRTVTGLGFSPDALFVFDAGNAKGVFTNSAAGGNAFEFDKSTNPSWITSLGADGFTVGADVRVNAPGRTYHYVAWNELPGLMDVGSYAGNNVDNRDIAGVGFQPEWVVLKSTAGESVVQHFDSQGAVTDSSSYFTGNSADTNRIQKLQADGFQIGTNNDVNGNARTYTYMAFRQETPPTISDVVDQAINEGIPTLSIPFTVGDMETAAGSLSVVASSSNQAIVPDANIVIGGSGAARTVTITPAPDQYGSVTITLRVSDGFAAATDTFLLTVNPINDPPTMSVPTEIGVNEDEASALAAISFADPDAGAGNLQATFTVPQGTLLSTSGGGVTVGGTATNLTLTGTLVDVNAFIATGNLKYITALNDVSSVTLGVSINDLGNSGLGGPLSSATSNVTLNVTAVNDAPEHTVPAAQSTATNTAVTFSVGNGNAISVNDVDAGSNPIEMTLSVSNGTLTLAGTSGLTFSVGSGTGNASMTFSGTIADINTALDGLRYDPALGFMGSDGLNMTSNDLGNSGEGGPKTVNDTAVINVAFVNSAPVLSGANDLGAIDEDPATNPGTLVSALIMAQFSDADAGALSGIAVTAVDNTAGTWQYSTNGGSTWTDFGSPSGTAARLLAADADTFVRFVPNVNFNGAITNGLTFRAWDRTSGAAGGTADTTSVVDTVRDSFNAVSYSNDDGTAAWIAGWVDTDSNPAGGDIRVAGGQLVFSPPLILGGGDSIYREANLSGAISATLSFSYNNTLGLLGSISLQASGNGGGSYATLATFAGGSNPGSGSFSTDISAYIAGNTHVRFVVNGALLASGSLDVDDVQISYVTPLNGGSSAFSAATASSSITVNSVNDAPVGTVNTVTLLEDGSHVFSAAEFGFTDPGDSPANGLQAVRITTLPGAGTLTNNGVAVTAGQFVSAIDIGSALFVFTPAANANGTGYTSFTFQVQDNGGGSNVDATARTMTVDVTAVNDAPVGANNTLSIIEDGSHVFSAADFGFTDPNDSPANSLLAVQITTLPAAGSLTNNGVAVTAGQSVSALDISAGRLVFVPAADAIGTGYASFTFQVQDNGGGSNVDAIARTMTIDVTSVGDAPVGADNTVTVLEDDSHVFNAADFGFSDPNDSPADSLLAVQITTLPGAGSLTLNGTAVTAGQFVLESDITAGNLAFTPAADGNGAGYASFTFQVQDDGGGANLDPIARTMTVDVTAIDDTPINSVPGTQATNQDTSLVFSTAGGNAISISDVDAGASAVQLMLSATNGTMTLATTLGLTFATGTGSGDATMQFSGSTAAINAALDGLIFSPNSGFAGTAGLSIVTDDQGNTGSGGPLTASSVVNINVAATPAPPITTPVVPIIDPLPIPVPLPPVTVGDPVLPPAPTPVPTAGPETPTFQEVPSAGGTVAPEASPPFDLATESGRSVSYTLSAPSTRNAHLVGVSYTLPAAQWLMFGDDPAASTADGSASSFGIGGVGDGRGGLQSPALIDALDRLRDGLQEQSRAEALIVATTAAASLGLSVGYVLWLLRGGVLISTMLSSLPAWRLVDPLPILGRLDDENEDTDDDSIESLVAARNAEPVAQPVIPAEPATPKSPIG